MRTVPDRLTEMVAGVVEPMGYELVGVEYRTQGGGAGGGVLRIYIDRPEGITVDHCSEVSHQVSGLLDVEDPIPEHYLLEVSSPGLDRPLFTPAHYAQFVGQVATVKTREKLHERRRFKGRLLEVGDDRVVMEVDGERYELPFDLIEQGKLVPEF